MKNNYFKLDKNSINKIYNIKIIKKRRLNNGT